MIELAEKLHELFTGSSSGHGEYICYDIDPSSNKMDGQAKTIKSAVTVEMWHQHLLGDMGLGVIPIDILDQCVWGCIDIDDYHEFNHISLLKKIGRLSLPLIVCRSKSGGAHVFLFTSEPVPASRMREALRKCAAKLGHGGDTEIFPKQNQVLHSRGDVGNWLNMPYQDHQHISIRYALHIRTGKMLEPYDFIDLAESRKISYQQLMTLTGETDKLKVRGGNPFKYGFPCLEILYDSGIPEGGRNNVVFQLGVQMQFMYPGEWVDKFDKMAVRMTKKDPLPLSEITNIKRSLAKREYGPKCDQEPMCSHCDKATCRVRKFGIGTNANYALIENIVKIPTDPVIWFADVNGERTEFESEDLLNQRKFRKRVLEAHNIFPPIMKDGQWAKMLSRLLQNCDTQETYTGTSKEEVFYDHLEEFCTRRQGKERDELIRGIPFEEDGIIYFKMVNFNNYLLQNKYMHFTLPQRCQRVRNIGGGSKYMRVKGKAINVWFIPSDYFDGIPRKMEVPDMKEDSF